MPKQYIYTISRVGKTPITLYKICANSDYALRWLADEARTRNWGQMGFDWEIQSLTVRPVSEVYELDTDKVGYLCEVTEELFAREISNNCPNTELRGLSWDDLCNIAIEILTSLKNGG